jgi:hypothetical protein
MLAHYALGRQHHAVEAFRRCRSALESELGVEPMPDTKSLHVAIVQQVDAESLLPPREADAPPVAVTEPAREGLSALPVVTIVEQAGGGKLRYQVEPLARTLGARIGAGRCVAGRRDAVGALGAALADAVGRGAIGGGPLTPSSIAEAIRAHAPLVLVVEDLHRAEPESVAVLDELQRQCADVPVVVVASYRAAQVPAGHPLAASALEAPGTGIGSVVRGDQARTWLMRITAPLIAALRSFVTMPLWLDELVCVDEIVAVLPLA